MILPSRTDIEGDLEAGHKADGDKDALAAQGVDALGDVLSTKVVNNNLHPEAAGPIVAGATIVTSKLNSSYVEEALRSSHTLVPDELAGLASPDWSIEAVPADGELRLLIAGSPRGALRCESR